MKHTIFTAPKYKRLKHRLRDHPEYVCMGILEMLFQFGNANGDILNACDVEAAVDWQGEPGVILEALTDTGGGVYTNFLDILEGGKVRIHNFWEHAPDCVKNRKRQQEYREKQKRQREKQSVTNNNDLSRDSNTRVCDNNVTVCDSNDKRNETKRNVYNIDTNVSTAEPENESAKEAKQSKIKGTSKNDWKAKASTTFLFDAFNKYPSVEWRGNPKDCQSAWDTAAKEEGGYDVLLSKVLKHLEWWDRKYVPRFTKYLEERYYDAEPPENMKQKSKEDEDIEGLGF